MPIGIPIWMLLVSLLAGLAAAAVLFVKNKKQHYGKALNAMLFALRTLMVGLVVVLLFNPYVRQKATVLEPPSLLLLHDNSASVAMSSDSLFFKETYPSTLASFREALDRDFQVDAYQFGQEVSDYREINFTDQLTDLSAALKLMERRYYKRNVGAVLLFSDGIYNRGFDPSLLAENLAFPVNTVVLGDTLSYPDLFVKDVHHNKKVSLGASFPVRVTVGAVDCLGEKAVLTLSEDGRVLARQDVEISSNRFSKELNFMLDAETKGVRQIDVELGGLQNEPQRSNNVKRIFVEVQDQKFKVLCLADAPHPDLGALKSVLNDDCEMDFVFGRDELPDLSGYQLLVLHQTPSGHTDVEALSGQLERNAKIPMLVIVGNATEVAALGKLQHAIELHQGAASTLLDAKAYVNNTFSTFTLSDDLRKKTDKFPPLAVPYLEINPLSAHDDLLLQEVLGVKSGQPLMTFTKGDRKMAFLFGTNVWRWRLYNYYQDKNSAVFDELFSKTLKYLLMDADDGLNVFAKEEYYTNEPVVFTAELRNPSNELVNGPELSLQTVNKKTGESYDYVFSKRDYDYELNVGALPAGVYTYRVKTALGERELSASGSFEVVLLGIEAQRLTADVALLRRLSTVSSGKCYTVDQLQQLLDDLNDDPRITSVEHRETRFDDLIHTKWIFFVLIGLATVEWLLRKMFGCF